MAQPPKSPERFGHPDGKIATLDELQITNVVIGFHKHNRHNHHVILSDQRESKDLRTHSTTAKSASA